MVNQSKKDDPRAWEKWRKSGAIGNIRGRSYGRAYAFLDCNSSKEEIGENIPYIRQLVQTPKNLELYLADIDSLLLGYNSFDSELIEIAREAKEADIKYVLAAKTPANIGNRQRLRCFQR